VELSAIPMRFQERLLHDSGEIKLALKLYV
jgi:hypothetical protein